MNDGIPGDFSEYGGHFQAQEIAPSLGRQYQRSKQAEKVLALISEAVGFPVHEIKIETISRELTPFEQMAEIRNGKTGRELYMPKPVGLRLFLNARRIKEPSILRNVSRMLDATSAVIMYDNFINGLKPEIDRLK